MIYAVIGAGPRSGTSWVMNQLEEAGLPVYWTDGLYVADADNPYGYYESEPQEQAEQDDVICKVWPGPTLNQVGIARAVILYRERKAQLASIKRRMNGEEKEACSRLNMSAEDYIDMPCNFLKAGVLFESRRFRTETLDNHIEDIIEYLSEPFERSIN